MKKRLPYLIFPILALILELLPYGAVCIFAASPTNTVKKTFSYFSLTPFGYANFTPLITAVFTCLILVLLIYYCVTGNDRLARKVTTLVLIAAICSLGSLIFGIAYYSPVACFITLSLIAEYLLLRFRLQKNSDSQCD